MQETAQEYTKRILAHSEGKEPLRIQQSTAKKLAALLKRAEKKRLNRRPAPGKWSVAEILAHLADVEIVIGWRMRLVLGENGAAIRAFDQDTWAGSFRYAKRDPKISLETFRVLRENNLALLKSVPKNLLENYGMHQERGRETVIHMVRMLAGHDLNHLEQIEKILKKSRP